MNSEIIQRTLKIFIFRSAGPVLAKICGKHSEVHVVQVKIIKLY